MAGPIEATSAIRTTAAVTGTNTVNGSGVLGKSHDWRGVEGLSDNNAGVCGISTNFVGVWGESPKSAGVAGKSVAWRGVDGTSVNNAGVFGGSDQFVAIWAETKTPNHAALFAKGPALAGRFEGNVQVTGDIQLVNADCAENFDVMPCDQAEAEAGSVMVLGENGALSLCAEAYDHRVAGVISGAGAFRPAIVMDSEGDQSLRRPIALVGKVYCKVDADHGPIAVGDLLTTSPTTGHAMKAADTARALGAIMGKALASVEAGRTLIPILVCLQ